MDDQVVQVPGQREPLLGAAQFGHRPAVGVPQQQPGRRPTMRLSLAKGQFNQEVHGGPVPA
ncbi:hypothetical protein AQJ54_40290 [Streptomyces griseorubiginosus]|uniref:Uncharacterized protein n=1 Tax=Streptomyces griseorubiginosus TaxID=67304 RepID=A0A117QX73_9ACTN|nr:hypothetical protein AQJ54_40290 [Streptomyces griseorubiginosus]